MAANIQDQLKRAIQASGMTRYRLAKTSGVAAGVISHFMLGHRDVRLGTAARLAAILGVELVQTRKAPKGKATKRNGRKAGR